MILTGKAKEDFFKVFGGCEWEIDERYLFALIIEFFDNTKLHIYARPSLKSDKWWSEIDDLQNKKNYANGLFETRLSSIQSGIEKANDIYNAKF
jgi:hypothetical protein